MTVRRERGKKDSEGRKDKEKERNKEIKRASFSILP